MRTPQQLLLHTLPSAACATAGLHQKGRHRLLREATSADSGLALQACASEEETPSPWLNRDEVLVIQGEQLAGRLACWSITAS